MRLTVDNALQLAEALQEMEDLASEVKDAADGYGDLDGDTSSEAREARAEFRETWNDNIDDLEGAAVALVEVFGYDAQSKKKKARGR